MAPQKEHAGPSNLKKKHVAGKSVENGIAAREVRIKHGGASSQTSPRLQISQKLLNVFVAAFPHLLDSSNVADVLLPVLQKIKRHLYNREFDAAFGSREYLEAYIARWSPSRALCYVNSFDEAFEELLDDSRGAAGLPHVEAHIKRLSISDDDVPSSPRLVNITCLGGGAAELVGLAAVPQALSRDGVAKIKVTLLDKAKWSEPLDVLFKSLTSPAPASSQDYDYISDEQYPLIKATHLDFAFHQMDLLNPTIAETDLLNENLHNSNIITLMFTLNELYSSSITSTQSMLLNITTTVTPGTLLLVVDSAGSYSTVTMNQKEKRYPMQWLLDYTLMKFAPKALSDSDQKGASVDADGKDSLAKSSTQTKTESPLWELVMSTGSRWYRLPEVKYPVELEDMRYQQHLYRRI